MKLINDNPIKDSNKDLLNRAFGAETFAKHIFSFDYQEGLVIGICGEWGCGKTSYINLMRPTLEKNSIVVDFNPWMFSDTNNLVSLFFTEIAAQLEEYEDNAEIVENLEKFGELLSSLTAIPIIREIGHFLKFFSKKKKNANSLQKQRKKLIDFLSRIKKPITVILDDIDRLSSDELQSILKLVRLTGNFPNVIYLLAFDKERVTNILDSSNIDGVSYLEKIIQVTFDMPKTSQDLLDAEMFSSLDLILGYVDIDRSRWAEAYYGIIKPIIRNMRDVRRYMVSLSNTFNQIGKSINVIDLLCLEAIRIFYPETLREIFELKDILLLPSETENSKEKLIKFAQDNPINKSVLGTIFNRYNFISEVSNFSYNNSFKKDRRVADKMFFNLYFNQVKTSELNNISLSEKLWESMSSEEFYSELANIKSESLENVVQNLMNYEDDFNEKIALYAIPALYKNLSRVAERERGFFEFEAHHTWSALTYRLLGSIPDEFIVRVIYQLLDSCDLFAQLEIVGIIGYRENRGHKLVPEPFAKVFEGEVTKNIKKASLEELNNTYKLFSVIDFFVSLGGEINNDILNSEEILLSILKSSMGEIKSQRGNDPAIYREKILPWDNLIKIYNGEENLKEAIRKLEVIENLRQEEHVILAIKYKNGYRHSDNY